eukprot:scaffold5730_cov55-Cyclotella_meneghiniana.AAC.15
MKFSISSILLLSLSASALAASNGSTLLRGAPFDAFHEGSNEPEVEKVSNKEEPIHYNAENSHQDTALVQDESSCSHFGSPCSSNLDCCVPNHSICWCQQCFPRTRQELIDGPLGDRSREI